MQRFDYNSAKLNMSRSNEQLAKEKAAELKAKEQARVDAVLYQDPSRIRTGGSGSNQSTQQKKNPLDTHSFVRNGEEIDKSVKVTAPPVSEPVPEVKSSRVSHNASRYDDDDDVEDFKENFGKEVPNEETKVSVPETFVEVKPVEPIYDANGLSPGDALREYEMNDELERQRKEAALRQQMSARRPNTNNKSIVKSNVSKVADDEVQMSHLKKFPTDLALRAKALFPEATTMDDAVAAYIYLKEGKPEDLSVPDKIKSIANTFLGETVSVKDAQDELIKEILQLKMHDRLIAQKLETIELALVYTLFDHIGFRKHEQTSPGTVDFLEQGVADLINRLEKQSKLKQMRDTQRNGTPIK